MKETLSETIIDSANHDEKAKLKMKVNQLENELKTVALDWKSSRNMEECGCSTTFDAFNKKVRIRQAHLTRTEFQSVHLFSFLLIFFSTIVGHAATCYVWDAWQCIQSYRDICRSVLFPRANRAIRVQAYLPLVPECAFQFNAGYLQLFVHIVSIT